MVSNVHSHRVGSYLYENLRPRYRHNPRDWPGGNHDRYGMFLTLIEASAMAGLADPR